MSYQTLTKWIESLKRNLGCIWVILLFSKSVSQLALKESAVQVYVIPNVELIANFKTNVGCIWGMILFSKLIFQLEFEEILNSGTCRPKL